MGTEILLRGSASKNIKNISVIQQNIYLSRPMLHVSAIK
jgi:hypothetical protein